MLIKFFCLCNSLISIFLLKASKKKVYMLWDLQPDRSVTGGPWYSDQDLESEFVEVLNQQCFTFLQQKVLDQVYLLTL